MHVASFLNKEHGQVADDPAQREAATQVASAMQVGDKAASLVASYGADWAKVVGGAAAALFAVATSDLSGRWARSGKRRPRARHSPTPRAAPRQARSWRRHSAAG